MQRYGDNLGPRAGENHVLHGRISHLPALKVSVSADWENGRYVMGIDGQVHVARVFGGKLVLTQRITSLLAECRMTISADTEQTANVKS